MYQRKLPADIRPCCGHVNRGLAILGDKVFLGTLDAHVIALDAKTGNVIWDVVAADYRTGYSFTVAPLAVKNLVVIGVSGGEYGVRGFIDAYDADTGERKWRFYTVPGPGEPGHETWEGDSWKVGGAPAWNTGTYDRRDESDFLAHGQSCAFESRRRARRRQPLQQFPARAERRHRQAELVLPVHQARRARLGRDPGSRHDRRAAASI